MAWMDVVNLHPLLTLFTIVILLAGLFFLYPVVSFSDSNNVMPSPPTPGAGNRESNFPPPIHCIHYCYSGGWFTLPVPSGTF